MMKRSKGLNNSTILLINLIYVLFVMSFASMSYARPASYELPAAIDQSARYFFFLHNYYVETQGPNGACKYYDILKAFESKGLTVISEVRSGIIIPSEYAKKIVRQVRRLLSAGVSPERTVIAGHSKGAVIALCVASQLKNPKIGFIIMAGCKIKPLEDAYPDFAQLKGNFLSIYASSDLIASSCQNVFSNSIIGTCYQEITLKSNEGHRLFFEPKDIWIDPLMDWIGQRENHGN